MIFEKKLKIFAMDDYMWVIARSKEEAIEWYSGWFKKELCIGDEKYDPEECEEINYNAEFWIDSYNHKDGKKKGKWFLKKKNLPRNKEIPGIIFTTEY